MLWHFQTGRAGYQFVESERWMGDLGVSYVVGVDGISLFMIVLTALLFPIGLLASAKLTVRVKAFTAWMLLLEAALLGVFLALDLIVFFVFFEFVLVPMYFIILGWGHDRRNYAALKFFLYTMAGSAFLLVGLLALGFLHQSATGHLTFDLRTLTAWAPGGLDDGTAKWLFLAFFAAFAVKVPLFPLHTWLPDAHTEAPTAGSVILAGVLLKMGTYGFLRFSLALFPQASVDLAPLLLVLGTVGIIYGAIVAAMQPNLKRIVAYSSVAHLGFVVLGIFALTTQGLEGGIFTMISHGLTTGALFLLVGMLYDRRHTFEIGSFGGLWKSVPILGGLFLRRGVRVDRPARLLGLHRRVPVADRHVHHRQAVRDHRRHRRDPRRRLPAVGLPARVHGRAERGEPQAPRDQPARARVRRAPARAQPLPRLLPEAGARSHRAVGEGAHRAGGEELRLPRTGCGRTAVPTPVPCRRPRQKEATK